MQDTVRVLVEEAIALTGLPIMFGVPVDNSDQDLELVWSGRRTEGLPEDFFAHVHIGASELALGFFVEVSADGYKPEDRQGFATPYYGTTISAKDLEGAKRPALVSEIRNAIERVWNDLPELYVDRLRQDRKLEELRQNLRDSGLLYE